MSTSRKSKAAKALVLCSLMLALTSGNTLPDGPKVSSSKVMPRSLPEFMPAVGQKKTTPTASPSTTRKDSTTKPTPPAPTPEEPPVIPEDIEPE